MSSNQVISWRTLLFSGLAKSRMRESSPAPGSTLGRNASLMGSPLRPCFAAIFGTSFCPLINGCSTSAHRPGRDRYRHSLVSALHLQTEA